MIKNTNLTLVELEIFNHQLITSYEGIYNLGSIGEIKGELDLNLLKMAYNVVVQQNPTCRYGYITNNNVPSKFIGINQLINVQCINIDEIGTTLDIDSYLQTWVSTPFDLACPPLIRAVIITLSENHFYFCHAWHHLIMDGTGFRNFYKSIADTYSTMLVKPYLQDHNPEIDFHDQNIVLDQKYITSKKWKLDETYWQNKLSGRPEPFPLIEPSTTLTEPTFRVQHQCEQFLWNNVIDYCKKLSISPLPFFLLVIQLVFADAFAYKGVTVGLPTHRRHKNKKKNIGLSTGVSPIILDAMSHDSISEAINKIAKGITQDYKHIRFPISKISNITASTGLRPIYDILFSYEPISFNMDFGSAKSWTIALCHHREVTPVAIYLRDYHTDRAPVLDFQFNRAYFSQSAGEEIIDRFISTVSQLVNSIDQTIANISLLSHKDNQLYHEINATIDTNYQSLITRIKQHATNNPQKIAIIDTNGQSYTYQYLWQHVILQASWFNDQGLAPKSKIVLALPRGVELITAMLAANYLGVTYCPIENNQPLHRIEQIIQSAEPSLVLTSSNISLTGITTPIFNLNAISEHKKIADPYLKDYDAYLLYTSGSTGKPKGVVIGNRARDNFLESCTQRVDFNSNSRIASITSPSFDISILELLGALYAGGQCIIVDEVAKRSGHNLSTLIDQYNITHLQATPTTWQLLIQTNWHPKTLITALVGGEALTSGLITDLQSRCHKIINMYGPTEATVWVMANSVLGEQPVEPIGNLLANCEAYVVDNHMRSLPINVIGELALSGLCLAERYDNAPELTALQFRQRLDGKRLYLTGDRVKLSPSGTFQFLGRLDSQIKRRGFRIELGEIESACTQINGINHAAAYYRIIDDTNEQKLVILYHGTKTPKDVQNALTLKLPNYMYPDLILQCRKWPQNNSGKTDRKTLWSQVDISTSVAWGEYYDITTASSDSYSECLDQRTLSLISASWEKVLNHSISKHAKFLECGGNSLLAMLLLKNLRKQFNTQLPDTFIFTHPTIIAQAIYIQPAINKDRNLEINKSGKKRNRLLDRRKNTVEA